MDEQALHDAAMDVLAMLQEWYMTVTDAQEILDEAQRILHQIIGRTELTKIM